MTFKNLFLIFILLGIITFGSTPSLFSKNNLDTEQWLSNDALEEGCEPIEEIMIDNSSGTLNIDWYDPLYSSGDTYEISFYINGVLVITDITSSPSYSIIVSTLGANYGDNIEIVVKKICADGTESDSVSVSGIIEECPEPEGFTNGFKKRDPICQIVALDEPIPFNFDGNDMTTSEIVKLSPNPSKGLVTINLSVSSKEIIETVSIIHSVLGRSVMIEQVGTQHYSSFEKQVDLSSYPQGVYEVIITTRLGNRYSSKLVLQK